MNSKYHTACNCYCLIARNLKVNILLSYLEPFFRTDSVTGTDGPAIKLVLKWDSRIVKKEDSKEECTFVIDNILKNIQNKSANNEKKLSKIYRLDWF